MSTQPVLHFRKREKHMAKLRRTSFFGIVAAVPAVLLISVLVGLDSQKIVRADPPKDQTYTGSKRCASCHFTQYMSWKKTKHAKSFDLLPAKYQTDAKCLKCHTTGYGTPSGYKDQKSTPSLAGTTCESCHGPGSKHDEIAQKFKTKKELTPEEEKLVKGSIWLTLPKNVCVECHTMQGHKKSETPPELQKK